MRCRGNLVAHVQGAQGQAGAGRWIEFVDSPSTIEVEGGNRYRFENCVIATGSVPGEAARRCSTCTSPRIMDSTGAAATRGSASAALLVVGGGYIGLELGYVYAALGSKVTVVEMTEGLLPGVDRDLVRPLRGAIDEDQTL